MASLLDEESLLLSNEVIRTRASVLEENMCRWGYMNTWVCSNDPKDIGRLSGYFDLIVVDAPCSGSGLFRKDPRALDEWSEANVALCSQRQQRILADVWPALKEDGILIYSTCSYSPQEDEGILNWLQQEFEVEILNVPLQQEWGITEVMAGSDTAGYRFFPDKVKGEGFFVAAIRKRLAQKNIPLQKIKTRHDKTIFSQAAHLLEKTDWLSIPKDNGYSAIHPGHEADLNVLEKYVYLRRVGLPLGEPSKKEWLPSHDTSLFVGRSQAVATLEASKEQALKFLKKEDAGFPHTERGWYIVTYKGLGLGWTKSLGNRFNNYLPKHWRIRMDINEME
jgi:NOL1/NOP2/fmu family ribosome biogenesis protein